MAAVTNPQATLLLVDDQRDVLDAMRRVLARDRYRVLHTTRPSEAVQLLMNEDLDVIVSDIEMPEMSGLELMAVARDLRPDATRIIVTGAGTAEAVTRAINEGEVHRFVHKPYEPVILRTIVAEAIARRQELARASLASRTAQRRGRLFDQLEQEQPGITAVDRDSDGAYVLRDERVDVFPPASGTDDAGDRGDPNG